MVEALVSVVIPTYNRVDSLCRVLDSYLCSPTVCEVIIVDDAGTDDTAQRIGELALRDSRLRYLRNERNLGAPATRNKGAANARGAWILESEDDLALGEHYIETLLDHARAMQADIISGRRVWMRLGESEQAALQRANRDRNPPFNERLMDHNSHALTENDVATPLLAGTMLIKREVFGKVQYFVPYGGQSTWREESDYQLSALEHGFKVVFCPHAVSFHHSRASQSFGRSRLKGTVVYAYRVFRNNRVFLQRHRDYLRRNFPRALIVGSPLITSVAYGCYRAAWLLAAEIIRAWRTRKYGAPSWQ